MYDQTEIRGTSFTWGVATATLPVEQFMSAAICRFRSTPIVVASGPQIELSWLQNAGVTAVAVEKDGRVQQLDRDASDC